MPEEEDSTVHAVGSRTYLVADVEPLDVDGVRTLQVGTILWGIAFLLLLPFTSRLRESGNLWWMWTCLAGLGLGLVGWDYCRRRRNDRPSKSPRDFAGPRSPDPGRSPS